MTAPEVGRRLALAAALVLLAVGLGLLPIPPVGPPPADAGQDATLEMVAQSPWVAPNGRFELAVRAAGAPPGATLELSVRNQVASRESFRRGVESDAFGTELLALPARPIDRLADDDGVVSYSFRLAETALDDAGSDEPGRQRLLMVTDGGVFPVVATLRDADGIELDTLAVHLIRAPQLTDEIPLAVALVLPVKAPPSLQPDGTRALDATTRSRLAAVIAALATHRDVTVTVDITPDTLLALRDTEPALFDELRAAVADRDVLARPFVDVDATAWLDAGLTSEFIEQLSVGIETVRAELGVEPTTSTWLGSATLTPEALSQIRGLGVTSLVLPQDQLEPLDPERFPLTLTQLFDVIDGNGVSQPTIAADAGLTADFTLSPDPVLAAHTLLADLAVLFFDQPGVSRGVVVIPPPDWVPSGDFLDALLPALGDHPLFEPSTSDGLFDRVSFAVDQGQQATFGFRLERGFEPEPADDLRSFAVAYTAAEADLVSFEGLLPVGVADGVGLRELLLSAGAARLSPEDRSRYLSTIADRTTVDAGTVSVTPPGRVTLASRTDDIPLVINNALDHDLNVVIGLTSDKLDFPEGAELEVTLASGSNEIAVPISTRTSGDSILALRVTSPDRTIQLTSTRIVVRSTAISGVGLLIAVVALLFLIVWWVRHARADRRDRRRLAAAGRPAPSVPAR